MQQVEERSATHKLSHHVEVALRVQTDPHVQHNIRVSQLVQHLDFLYEIFQSFLGQVPLSKAFHCDFRSHPVSLENVSIAATPDKVSPLIHLQIFVFNEKVEAIFAKRHYEAGVLANCGGRFWIKHAHCGI